MAGAYTYNYYQFYPALRQVALSIPSFQFNPVSNSLNALTTFNIENPTSYQGLTMTDFQIYLTISPPGVAPISDGIVLYTAPLSTPLGSGKPTSLIVPVNGTGSAPSTVYQMIQSQTAVPSQFILNYTVHVYLSTFMDTYASVIILFVCSSQGTGGACLQGAISLATKGPSNNSGPSGGL